jgi:tRNA pseudouridine55 synthase
MNGILAIDKPVGLTSHDVVVHARRVMKIRRVGHTGTLDPFATGVLLLCVGLATRLSAFLSKEEKEYVGRLRLGLETDTLDATGRVVKCLPVPPIDRSAVEEAFHGMLGSILQQIPVFSAAKRHGIPMYRRAHQGETSVEAGAKQVFIHRLELLGMELPYMDLRVVCSTGTYIRMLAADIGRVLGCCAHLSALRRIRCGALGLDCTITMEQMKAEAAAHHLESHMIPMAKALPSIPSVKVDKYDSARIRSGQVLRRAEFSNPLPTGLIRILDHRENLVALGRTVGIDPECTLRPVCVFPENNR